MVKLAMGRAAAGAPADPPVVMDDEADGLEEHGILGVGVLHLLGLGWLLGLVEDGLQALSQAASHRRVFWARQKAIGPAPPQPALPTQLPAARPVKSSQSRQKRWLFRLCSHLK